MFLGGWGSEKTNFYVNWDGLGWKKGRAIGDFISMSGSGNNRSALGY